MSLHIAAHPGAVADTILLPGDPLRARFIAENYLKNPVCYNEIRGILGYTGTYKGKQVSVQGTGMGIPSISIYVNELIRDYGVKKLMRVGSCGSIREKVALRDLILAMTASTDSSMNKNRFGDRDFCPPADYTLLRTAADIAEEKKNALPHGKRFYHRHVLP